MADLSASFTTTETVTGPAGQLVHRDSLAHTDRFARRFLTVRPGVWCYVGNGLSNQTFIEGPTGVIAIDTGECVEEMQSALAELDAVTDRAVTAAIYTHSHYVGGTAALPSGIPIWAHERLVENRRAYGAEFSPAAGRGLVHQFGMALPPDGPDGLVNVGLGLEFRRAEHAPFTAGFVEPTETLSSQRRVELAGLEVHLTPAPSDADDSLTIWIPELDVAVNNLVWPTLFNVFAIRGEQYRDPRILLDGLDHLIGLDPEHLVGTHGPPISGREHIHDEVVRYRDSIQFLWDQSVRGINRGLTSNELTRFVQMPEVYRASYLTTQFYGLAEHHVRQIHTGLRGWFDGDPGQLFPLHPVERAERLLSAMGGAERVRELAEAALDDGDLRWALELANLLTTSGDPDGKPVLAAALRAIAHGTTAANIRNWCLTRARELDGLIDLRRFGVHRFNGRQVRASPPDTFVHALRVVLDPERAAGVDTHLRWDFDGGQTTGLWIRNHVAVPTDGAGAHHVLGLTLDGWARILTGELGVEAAFETGEVSVEGNTEAVLEFFRCFDHPAFRDPST